MLKKHIFAMIGLMSAISFSTLAFDVPPEIKNENFDRLNVTIYKLSNNNSIKEVISNFSIGMPTMVNKNGKVVPVEIPSYTSRSRRVSQGTIECDKPNGMGKCKISTNSVRLSTDFKFTSIYLKQNLAIDYPTGNKTDNKVLLDIALDMDELVRVDIVKKNEFITEATPVTKNHKLKFKALMDKGVTYSYLVSKGDCSEPQEVIPCGDIYMDLNVEKKK